jgi:ribosome-associated translation inhibitor RaiA
MQVQVHTDNHIQGSAELAEQVENAVTGAMERFGDRVTRVVVRFADENGQKPGTHDKRCVVEARLAGLPPITAKHLGPTVAQSLHGALDKLEKHIEHTVGRREEPRSRTTYGGDQTI